MTLTEGRWEKIEIQGRLADIYEPARPAAPARALLYLHGQDLKSMKDCPALTVGLEQFGFRAICPYGGSCWWCDVVCKEFDPTLPPLAFVREHVVPEFAKRWDVRPPGIGLLGIGTGGQGVLQMAYRDPKRYSVVAAISPAIDFHNCYGRGLELDEMFPNQESARQATVTLALHPLNWPRHQLIVSDPEDPIWFDGAERLISKLRSIGIPFESDLTTSRGGFGWDYVAAMSEPVLRFHSERLEQLLRVM